MVVHLVKIPQNRQKGGLGGLPPSVVTRSARGKERI